jgi:spore coat polysaccharide biosynthesis protein SpsF
MFENVMCIIQARMGSTRLPKKVLMKIGNKTVLQRVIDRVKAVNLLAQGPLIDEIWVATSKDRKDDPIARWCKKHGVNCYRGSEGHVLERFYQCWIQTRADLVLRITADCPFISPVILYGLLTKNPKKDYQAMAFNSHGIPGGWDCELFSGQALERAYKAGKSIEHVTQTMRKKLEDSLDYGLPFDYSEISLELNEMEDLGRLKAYERLL